MLPVCLAVFGMFTVTDLAHRRELEGQICADVLRCHIASDARIRETSEQPARLSGQMASHHLPSHSEEADVKGKRASLEGGGDVWPPHTAQDGPSTSTSTSTPLSLVLQHLTHQNAFTCLQTKTAALQLSLL